VRRATRGTARPGLDGRQARARTEIRRPALLQLLSESAETDDAQGNAIGGVVGQNPEIFADLVVGRVARWGLTLELLGADALIPPWAAWQKLHPARRGDALRQARYERMMGR
jgi:hypothetical protein